MSIEGIQKCFQAELEKLQSVQKDEAKYMSGRQKLEGQKNENQMVIDELILLEEDAKVFKMIGPVLVKQDLPEAKATVNKRLEYINGEIKRLENLMKDIEKKKEGHRESLTKLQQQLQQAQVKAAAKF